jgi:hypothetical protein
MDPMPPKEFGVSEVTEVLPTGERRFIVRHLEKGQSVALRFVVSGVLQDEVRVFPFNEAGDVEVLPGAVNRARDDRESLERLLILLVLCAVVTPIFHSLPLGIGRFAASVAYLVFAVAMVPLLAPSARVVAGALSKMARSTGQHSVLIENLHLDSGCEMSILVGDRASLSRTTSSLSRTTSPMTLGARADPPQLAVAAEVNESQQSGIGTGLARGTKE